MAHFTTLGRGSIWIKILNFLYSRQQYGIISLKLKLIFLDIYNEILKM